MNRKNSYKIYFFILLLFAFNIYADDLAQFGSNSAECSESTAQGKIDNICIYSGNAKFDQGEMHLYAPKITVYRDAPTNLIYQIIAYGDATTKAFYSTVFTPENTAKATHDTGAKKIKGVANLIKIFPPKNLVTLNGDAEITRENDKFDGEYFEYDIKKQTVLAKPALLGHTKMIIYPQK